MSCKGNLNLKYFVIMKNGNPVVGISFKREFCQFMKYFSLTKFACGNASHSILLRDFLLPIMLKLCMKYLTRSSEANDVDIDDERCYTME